ncbi:sodium channel protein Nach-like isoform X2 [Thrips palmi]|uniref:Sodium channel protein Nach-like isoform X2 n=1 Tax=Thrips palmi TaxID=161013 RepID=A0A6P9AFF1_THRPL|nr:sodium channel protein Nach-like isoform X2 [Thrips palmi]
MAGFMKERERERQNHLSKWLGGTPAWSRPQHPVGPWPVAALLPWTATLEPFAPNQPASKKLMLIGAHGSMATSPLKSAVRQTINEFSENTSIHGVHYITEHGRRWIERLVWIVTELVCIVGAVFMLLYLLYKFQDNPTMTRVESSFHQLADLPFPAITLCNVNRIFRSKAQRFVEGIRVPETLSVSQQDVLRLLPLLGQLLSSAEIGRNIAGRARLDAILKYNNLTPEVVLEQVGQTCSELIERCSWEGREVDCPSVFSRTMTFMGFCCSFNADVDFSVAAQPSRVKREPLKTPYFGYPLGLTVLLHPHTEDYYWGPFVSGGVMCAVHDSNEMATERSPQAMVALGKESMVQMVPRIRNASPSLRDVTPQRRRCLFEDENPTSASDQYSDHMCAIECAAAKLWRTCKCRPLNLPRIRGPRGTLCGLDKLPCLAKFNEEEHDAMVKSQVRGDLLPSSPAEADKLSEEITQMCGCLAQCNSIDYELETTTANFGASRMVRRNFYKDLNATSRCLLHVYYDQQTSTLFINDLVSNTVQLMCAMRLEPVCPLNQDLNPTSGAAEDPFAPALSDDTLQKP